MVRESHLWYNKFNIQTHKLENNYITEVLTQGREFPASSQAPQGRGLVLRGGASRAFGFHSKGAWVQEFHRTGGWTPHVEGAHKVLWEQGPTAKGRPQRRLGWTYLLVLEGVLWRQGAAMALSSVAVVTLGRAPPLELFVRGRHLTWVISSKTTPCPTACRLQSWRTSGQTIHRAGTQPHSLAAQFSSVAQSCPTLCNPMDCNMPGFPVHHQLPELTQTHVHRVGDAIRTSHPPSSPSPPAFNLSQHQGLFQWVSSSHQVAKVLATH